MHNSSSSKGRFVEIEYLERIRLEKISHHVYPFEFRNTNMGIKSLKYLFDRKVLIHIGFQ